MSNSKNQQKKMLTKAISGKIMEYLGVINGIDEPLLQRLVWQSSRKLAKKYCQAIKQNDKVKKNTAPEAGLMNIAIPGVVFKPLQ